MYGQYQLDSGSYFFKDMELGRGCDGVSRRIWRGRERYNSMVFVCERRGEREKEGEGGKRKKGKGRREREKNSQRINLIYFLKTLELARRGGACL